MSATKITRFIFIVLLAALALTAYGKTTQEAEETVFVSIQPLKYFADTITGGDINVSVLVPPGREPATYEPTSDQLVKMGESKVFFAIGVPYEAAVVPKLEELFPGLIISDLTEGIELRGFNFAHTHEDGDDHDHEEDGDEDHHDEGSLDPHIWMSPANDIIMTRTIADVLVSLYPENEKEWRANADKLISDLEALDKELETILAPYEGRKLFVYHPAYGYFTHRYGLVQVRALEEGGKEPVASTMKDFIHQAEEESVSVILVQPEFPMETAQVLAQSIGAEILICNPLSDNLPEELKRMAEALVETWKE